MPLNQLLNRLPRSWRCRQEALNLREAWFIGSLKVKQVLRWKDYLSFSKIISKQLTGEQVRLHFLLPLLFYCTLSGPDGKTEKYMIHVCFHRTSKDDD